MNELLNKSIGGFFELELGGLHETYHPDALALTSGRSCLNFIITKINPVKIYVPYYICDAVVVPLKRHTILYEYYAIDETFMPKENFQLGDDEYVLYVNYLVN